jgi:hypothetical protein
MHPFVFASGLCLYSIPADLHTRLYLIVGEILQTLGMMWCQTEEEAMEKDDKEDVGMPVSVLDYEGVRGKDGLIWINQNLWAALFRLRLEDRKPLIWADSVCINQADDGEKSWQVSAHMVPVSGR